eukprot:5853446-Pyramimonas_sp.AAC.1
MKGGVNETKDRSMVEHVWVCLQKWVGKLETTSTIRKSNSARQNGWCCCPRTSTSRRAAGLRRESGATSATLKSPRAMKQR